MNDLDLSKFSLTELKKVKAAAEREISKRANKSVKNLQKKIRALAAAEGLDMSDVSAMFSSSDEKPVEKRTRKPRGTGGAKPKTALEPKYFHQTDPAKTWSGRGRKPDWVVTWLENGGNIEELTIDPYAKARRG